MNSFVFVVILVFVVLSIASTYKIYSQDSRFISKLLLFEEARKKVVVSPAQYRLARELIEKDDRVKALYQKLKDLPRDGTPNRKFARSYVIRELLSATHSGAATSIIGVLADFESSKLSKKDTQE